MKFDMWMKDIYDKVAKETKLMRFYIPFYIYICVCVFWTF